MRDVIINTISQHADAVSSLGDGELQVITEMVHACVNTLQQGGKILLCGNGGSAADAQHLAAEFVVRFRENRRALAALALTTDTSALTACGNDFSFDEIFSRQVEALGKQEDVLIAISTSGNSPNVVQAVRAAKEMSIPVIGITGKKESSMTSMCDICLRVPSEVTARIQEVYMLVGHILCGLVEDEAIRDE